MESENLAELYQIRFQSEELPRKNAIWEVLCENFFQKHINPQSKLVDIACGYGEFLNNIKAVKKVAVDLNQDAKNFLSPDIDFHLCSATELSLVVQGDADVVFTSNFLEHLPDKQTLDLFLDQVKLALKPNGKYIILGPNLRYLPGKYWDFYDHHLGLTHLSLIEALKLKGFDIDLCIDKFLPFTTQGSLPSHPIFVRIYLLFPIVWKILGKQFFIVARSPSQPS
jgi:SAM-dependent methyltransferase